MSALTYADLLRRGTVDLTQAGLSEAGREARQLLLLASELSPALLIALENDSPPPEHIESFELMLQMRADRVPFAHIAGETEFFGMVLRSDSRALIPRSDSETVVELALSYLPETGAFKIADLGTGSGALLAAILVNRSHLKGIAVETSEAAMLLAEENFDATSIADRVELFRGSWSDWTGWNSCDLIISNPPYIRTGVIPTLAPEVQAFDPSTALDGGDDGLHAYRDVVAHAADQMKPGAILVFEIGFDQKPDVSALLRENGFIDLVHKQDLGGNDRAIAAIKS
ncbi:MAG: peptide chain release factor N(5)-glutamine methyltransferase [Pseudomonadota bacterium]